MSKKNEKLLQETTVRRFMGLAGIPAVAAENFVDNKLNELEDPKIEDTDSDVPGEVESAVMQEQEDEMAAAAGPPPEGMEPEGEVPPEGEFEDEGTADVDLTPEEAEVLIGLGQRLADEMPPEEGEELPPEGMAPEGPPVPEQMAESFLRKLSQRVSQRLITERKVAQRKELFVGRVMQRVARRLQRRR